MYLITDGSTLIRTTTSTGNEPSRAGEPMDAEEFYSMYLITDGSTLIRTTTSTGNEPSRAGEPMDAKELIKCT